MIAMKDLPTLEVHDYIGCAIAILQSIALLFSGLFKNVETYIKVNIGVQIFMAIGWLIMPVTIMKTLDLGTSFDGGHMWLTQISSIVIFYSIASMFICLGTDDNTVTTSLLWSRITMVAMFLLNMVHWYVMTKGENTEGWVVKDVHFATHILTLSSWMIGSVAQLIRVDNFGGYMEHFNRLNVHVRVDSFFLLIAGVTYMAFLDWFLKFNTTLKSVDALHLYLGRSVGIVNINSAIFIGFAPKFLFEMTKVRLLLCGFICVVAGSVSFAVTMHSHDLLDSKWFLFGVPILIVWAGNNLSGFLFSRFGQLK